TSICRSRFTTCSGVCFFRRAIVRSLIASFYQSNWFKKRRALQADRSCYRIAIQFLLLGGD
ncbi:hypothetical protein, partial [Granulicella paludicola]|uniref:hypothetical protein n=1 Tax=Granulicella paludicola TaxID=474951 RepID=UPI0021DF6900